MIEIMREATEQDLIKSFNEKYLDAETAFKSNAKIGTNRVDIIYVQYDRYINTYPVLMGYAHNEKGEYTSDWFSADDITNCDLHPYMNGYDIIDFEGMIRDNPKMFYIN